MSQYRIKTRLFLGQVLEILLCLLMPLLTQTTEDQQSKETTNQPIPDIRGVEDEPKGQVSQSCKSLQRQGQGLSSLHEKQAKEVTCERCLTIIKNPVKFDGKLYCSWYCSQRDWAIGQALKHCYQSGYSL